MKKTILTSIAAIAMCCPAIAATDIASDANSANCTESVLNTTSGTSNLEAKWTANTLNIDWYNGDDKITSTTCTYDGGINVPSNDPEKTGYTFNGWKLRRAPAAPALPNCSAITDETTCENTPGCAGPSNMTFDEYVGAWGYKFTTGCFRPVWADTVSYTSCSEITDPDICNGLVVLHYGYMFRLCEMDNSGRCVGLGTGEGRDIWSSLPVTRITEAFCENIGTWDSSTSTCYTWEP